MEIHASQRVQRLGHYAFAAIDEKVTALTEQGLEPVDFGVGDPTTAPPERVRRATAEGIERFKSSGYPPYAGRREFLEAAAAWMERRFGVTLDPVTELCATIGSKEAVFHFPEALVDPGDVVIIPDPGYPPYARGTRFAEGEPYYVPLTRDHGFLPDLDAIPDAIARRARIFWLTHPSSPAGVVTPRDWLERWIDYCQRHAIVAASDEAYTEIYFGDEPPASALEIDRDGVIVFQSLSKRSAMTGYRIGWVCGDQRIVKLFRQVKTNIDSGAPWFVQEGAIAALGDEQHVAEMREEYRAKRDVLVEAFAAVGCPDSTPEASLYIWQRAPQGWTALDLAEKLLVPEIAAVTMPGPLLSDLGVERHPDLDYVRLALVPSLDDCRRVAAAIREHW